MRRLIQYYFLPLHIESWTFWVDLYEDSDFPSGFIVCVSPFMEKGHNSGHGFPPFLHEKEYIPTTCHENAYSEVIWHPLKFLWVNSVSFLGVVHLGNWGQLLNNSWACGSWGERGPRQPRSGLARRFGIGDGDGVKVTFSSWGTLNPSIIIFVLLSLQGVTRGNVLLRDSVCC